VKRGHGTSRPTNEQQIHPNCDDVDQLANGTGVNISVADDQVYTSHYLYRFHITDHRVSDFPSFYVQEHIYGRSPTHTPFVWAAFFRSGIVTVWNSASSPIARDNNPDPCFVSFDYNYFCRCWHSLMTAEYSTIVASAEEATVAYLTADHLGSPRRETGLELQYCKSDPVFYEPKLVDFHRVGGLCIKVDS
jgi:hypothetical protein